MITRLSAFLQRNRRVAVVAGLALGAAELAAVPGIPEIAYAATTVIGVTAAAAGVAVSQAARQNPASGLIADDRARTLATPRTGAELLFALTALQALALFAGLTLTAALDGQVSRLGLIGSLLFGGMLAVSARSLPRGVGVILRPDGIQADKLTGELFVPWDALAPALPGPGADPRELTLAYARPELVRTTGIVPDPETLEFEGMDRARLGAAIHSYARHPQARHAIGTAAEQERLRAGPDRAGYGVRPLPEPPAPRATVVRALSGAILLGGAVTLQIELDPRHPVWSLFALLPGWIGLRQLRRARADWRDRRRPAA